MDYCCGDFKYYVYSHTFQPTFQPYAGGGTWDVACCKSGCCVILEGLKFCPFCGTAFKRREAETP